MRWDLSNEYARASACRVVEELAPRVPIPDVNVAGAPGRQIFVVAATVKRRAGGAGH
jgi:hypothetical protein